MRVFSGEECARLWIKRLARVCTWQATGWPPLPHEMWEAAAAWLESWSVLGWRHQTDCQMVPRQPTLLVKCNWGPWTNRKQAWKCYQPMRGVSVALLLDWQDGEWTQRRHAVTFFLQTHHVCVAQRLLMAQITNTENVSKHLSVCNKWSSDQPALKCQPTGRQSRAF